MKLKSLKKILTERSLDACLIENPVDLLYATGLECSKGRLVVKPNEERLFVDGRYLEAAKKTASCPVLLSEGDALQRYVMGRVGFDSAFVTYLEYQRLIRSFPEVEWVPIPSPLRDERVCKDSQEIASLRRAAHLTMEGYKHLCGLLREGISEEELAFEFEFFCRKRGASGLSFQPIVAFGENSAYPHHRAGKSCLRKNQIVLIDVGAIVDRYCGDMTRFTFFGEPDPELFRLSEIVRRAQRKAVEMVRPGLVIGELDRAVREVFQKEGVEELFTHSLGHGIGLETHEYPRIKWNGEDAAAILRPGMVCTIEPGLYRPGLGGIRYEDMILVKEQGYENLMDGSHA